MHDLNGVQVIKPATAHRYLSDEDYMLPTELFLQLPHQPDLDFLERLELRNWDKDDNSFPTATNFNFLKKTNPETA